MLLKIFKNRTVSSSGTWGTKNENNYEILNFEFPEELEEYNKRIVYYLDNQKVWDAIIDNKAILTNAITTKGSVKAYIWCTKTDAQYETDVDFRTQLFEMNFFENENADGIVPTEEQIDGFNTMLTAMNEKIEEIDELETTIKNAETQRQENEETRQNNEKTRQENEQTRQTQEAERERRTDEAIADIEDKTAEYNANAEAKTTAFNNNATQKTNDFNSNYTQKVNDFNTNASSKGTAFNSNAETKTNAFNTNATNKTNAFNSNATEKTSEFNTNAESKTSAFNDNATQKTTNFDNNASEKTDEFNTNAQEKIDEYDEHIVEYQEQIDELQEEVEELSENMPWNTTEQATEISVNDAAKYSRNKLELFGNTEQASYDGKNILKAEYFYPISANGYNSIIKLVEEGDNYLTFIARPGNQSSYNIIFPCKPNTNYVYKCEKIILYNENDEILSESGGWYSGNSKAFSSYTLQDTTSTAMGYTKYVSDRSGALSGTNVSGKYVKFTTAEEETECCISFQGNKANKIKIINPMLYEGTDIDIDYEPYVGGQPSPSPDYPQDIHVVTGNNSVGVQGENLFDKNKVTIYSGYFSAASVINGKGTNNSQDKWFYIPCKPNTTYKIIKPVTPVLSNNRFRIGTTASIPNNNSTLDNFWMVPDGNTVTQHVITTSNNAKYLCIYYGCNPDAWGDKILAVLDGLIISYFSSYPINLGNIELCKIGDYQDYFYKENGNWYKKNIINKYIFSKTNTFWVDKSSGKFTFKFPANLSSLNYNNSNVRCNYYKPFTSYSDYGVISVYDYSVWIINPFDLTFTSEMTADEAKEKFKEIYDGHLIIYSVKKQTPTQITDTTLISQLDEIYEHLQLVKGTNNITVTAEDLAPYMELTYMQDIKSKLDNLDSRLALLE